jgi:uncharacterized protein YciW
MRAALACRIAQFAANADLERHFLALVGRVGASESERRVADLDFGGEDPRTTAFIRHSDLIARDPKSATGNDIVLLRQAGVSDPDIVRLSELIAFVSYQIRVLAGLKLMRAAS